MGREDGALAHIVRRERVSISERAIAEYVDFQRENRSSDPEMRAALDARATR